MISAPTRFRLRRENVGPVVVVRFHGFLGAAGATALRSLVEDVLQHESAPVVVDLAGTTDLDCHAVSALEALHRHALRRGRYLRVAAVPPRLRGLLDPFDLHSALGGTGSVAHECRAAGEAGGAGGAGGAPPAEGERVCA
ncbi:STAS domain-containing protein [Kineococcus sp. SYSU DK005]|uniref:STAS domain-containing protein n=1 Tax=Kineococcus sp. SYSU DK005 TaxID=3383126 RepID=UPI003D7EB6CE